MKIYITAKPRSKKEYVRKVDDTHYIVAVKEPPVAGRANKAIIKSLAQFFSKPPSQIRLLHGLISKQKVFDIPLSNDELDSVDFQKKLFQ